MERQLQTLGDESAEENHQHPVGKKEVQKAKQQAHLNPAATSPPPPSSASPSPSHEFSFTVSLHNKTKSSPPHPFAIDLSPADEIFFHGHLLPLHLLSHLPPVSPRTSTNSSDNFTLPINEQRQDKNSIDNKTSSTDNRSSLQENRSSHVLEGKGRGKSKSFSLFGITSKWRKGCEPKDRDQDDENDDQEKKRKSKFDVVKRYMRLVKLKPGFLSFRSRRGNPEFPKQQYSSYSGNLRVRSKKEMRGRRGEFSAPASMRTSPTDSGHFVASGAVTPTKSDSSMEELQAAIQAAIAHCKKSISSEDKIKLP